MKHTAGNRRPRSRQTNKRGGGNPRNQGGNRKDPRVRGNANQQAERYKSLARDALQAGDRVLAENYFQHADHYQRVLNERMAPREDPKRRQQPRQDATKSRPQQHQSRPQPQSRPQEAAKDDQKAEGKVPPAADNVEPVAPSQKADGNGRDKADAAANPGRDKADAATKKSNSGIAEPSLESVAFLKPDSATSKPKSNGAETKAGNSKDKPAPARKRRTAKAPDKVAASGEKTAKETVTEPAKDAAGDSSASGDDSQA